jgi:spore coat polysaccharide biosynthesis protein SpsF (cytidylyltransferase family)/aryl-alcohol dehydrogenase-like predicted oxidoreductase
MQKCRAVAILQVRTSSSRLPGKALLPISALPSVVLSARRAGNTGLEVRVATSDDPSDDQLATTLAKHHLTVFRGSLQNVLARFTAACVDLDPDDVIIRLTADNMLPDGIFLQRLIDAFEPDHFDYLGTHSPMDGMPYGMSAELFTVDALRRAAAASFSSDDTEHVTPWIRRHLRMQPWVAHDVPPYWSRLRCTIDTFADFQSVANLFKNEADPVGVSHVELTERLALASELGHEARTPCKADSEGRVASRLTLGGVQFGVAYGIANTHGCPDDTELAHLLELAVDAGVTTLDTARAYGQSESRIGRWLQSRQESRLRVITKLDVLNGLPFDAPPAWVRSAVDASFFESLSALRTTKIDTLMLHRWSHHDAWRGEAWQRLLALRDAGLISSLGCSVSSPEQAIEALSDRDVVHVQCPVNLLDHRWRDPRWLEAVQARPDVTIHARSVLLQGLVTLPAERWPIFDGKCDATHLLARIDDLALRCAREGRIDLCIGYVASLPWVCSLVMGVDTTQQLRENMRLISRPALTAAQRDLVHASLQELPLNLLDPSQWKFAHAA